jgi:hypothetical protein
MTAFDTIKEGASCHVTVRDVILDSRSSSATHQTSLRFDNAVFVVQNPLRVVSSKIPASLHVSLETSRRLSQCISLAVHATMITKDRSNQTSTVSLLDRIFGEIHDYLCLR